MTSLRIVSVALAAAAFAGCSTDSPKTADTAAGTADTGGAASPRYGAVADTATPPAQTRSSATAPIMDPNSATAAELSTIPGVTTEVASALVAARPYSTMVAVDRVLARTLSEQQRDSVYARLWLPIDLNTATGEEIPLIPGVGPRMRHEFEEYRPYTSIAQ